MNTPSRRVLAAEYNSLYRNSPFHDAPKFYRWLIQQTGIQSGDTVLDIGCGIGGALQAITANGGQAIGLDFSREALEIARGRCKQAILVEADGTQLPFTDQSFKTLLNLGNLEHFADIRAGIREMRRVLRPDGQAWVLLPNLFYSGTLWKVITQGYGPDHHQPLDRFATRNEWRDLLNSEGLQVLTSQPYHKGKAWKKLLPSNLAWHFLYCCQPGPSSPGHSLNPLGRVRHNPREQH